MSNIQNEPTLSTSTPAVCRRPIELCPVGACQPCDTSRRHAGSDTADPEALQAALVHRCENATEEEAQRILGGFDPALIERFETATGNVYDPSGPKLCECEGCGTLTQYADDHACGWTRAENAHAARHEEEYR